MRVDDLLADILSMPQEQQDHFLKNCGDPNVLRYLTEIQEKEMFFRHQEKAQSTLADFILYTKPDYDMNWHHRAWCNAIDEFLEPDNQLEFLILQGPPRSGKSEIVSRRLPAYYLGKNPDHKFIFTTYAAELAKSINRDVQRIIDSDAYHKIFPETILNSKHVKTDARGSFVRTSDFFELVGKQGSFKSVGIGGPLTGFGMNLGICDDVVKGKAEADSVTYSQRIWDWYTAVFLTRRLPGAKVILMMTRWKEDDLIGRSIELLKNIGKEDKFEVLSFPMVYEEDYIYENVLDERLEEGQALWPARYDENYCEQQMEIYGSAVWSALFQQRPTPSGGSIFKENWFKFYKELPEFDYTIMSLDATFKESEKSDYVVIGIWGIKGKNKYLIDVVRKRMGFVETMQTIYRLSRLHPGISEMIIETKANGDAIIDTIEHDEKMLIPIHKFNPTASKAARAESVSPQVEAGHVWIPDIYYEANREKLWVDQYVKEMTGFPNEANDDCVDMTSQFLIRVATQGYGWMESLLASDQGRYKQEQSQISRIMGWDFDKQSNSGFGLDF